MTHIRTGPETWSTVCAVQLFAVVLPGAPASADSTDDAFVAALVREAIAFPDNNTATAIAHTVCAGFDKTDKSTILVMKLMKDTDLSLKQSSYFVGAAIDAYCPAIPWAER